MCPPIHFGVLYEINPWMHREVTVDHDRARAQWDRLVATLNDAGAEVEVMEPHPDVPDLVFTANAGLVNAASTGRRGRASSCPATSAIPSASPRRRSTRRGSPGGAGGSTRCPMPSTTRGRATPCRSRPRAGGRCCCRATRSARTRRPPPSCRGCWAARCAPLQLVDPRLYHLDLTFCPLDGRRAIAAPLGWDAYGLKVVEALVPELLVLTDDEALSFCANSVVVDRTVVMPTTPPRVGPPARGLGLRRRRVPRRRVPQGRRGLSLPHAGSGHRARRLRRSGRRRSSRRRHGRRPPRSRRAAPRARRAPTARSRPPPGRCGRP